MWPRHKRFSLHSVTTVCYTENMSIIVKLRAPAEDKAMWQQAAEENGQTLSAWIRCSLHKAATGKTLERKEKTPEPPAEVIDKSGWCPRCLRVGKVVNCRYCKT
jgi:hypothetical protein